MSKLTGERGGRGVTTPLPPPNITMPLALSMSLMPLLFSESTSGSVLLSVEIC